MSAVAMERQRVTPGDAARGHRRHPSSTTGMPPPPASSAFGAAPPPPTAKAPTAPRNVQFQPGKPGKLTEQYGEPPLIIKRDRGNNTRSLLHRGVLLGEGGFARVYAATEHSDGTQKALKVISKDQLKTTKNRGKLFAEIKLHQAMRHDNIVRFEECFEDADNVFMVMEVCPNGSLLDLLKKRKRYTEPEARFYLVQLINSCLYMHSRSVIHRDLKLGNLFLDCNMNLKVGDFGLAALVRFPGERKKTICGTPNYIAPEILFDRDNGHSFEVDVWSIGVILYTLLVGKPPFQTKEVKQIYKRIKDNAYEFPENVTVSDPAVNLISSILNNDPDQRPSLQDILTHPFFHPKLPCPRSLPTSIAYAAPDFSAMRSAQSQANIRYLVTSAHQPLSPEDLENEEVDPPPAPTPATPGAAPSNGEEVTSAVAKQVAQAQETEVRSALAPDSPISELLSSARKPLVVSPQRALSAAGGDHKRSAIREAQQMPPRAVMGSLTNGHHPTSGSRQPASSASTSSKPHLHQHQKTMSNMMPSSKSSASASPTKSARSAAPATSSSRGAARLEEGELPQAPPAHATSSREPYASCSLTLEEGLSARSVEALDVIPAPRTLQNPKVFISSWIDYTHKYGTAYQLTDGTAGVFFNDSTTMVLSPNQSRLDYLTSPKHGYQERRNLAVDETFEPETDRKVYLLNYFRDYMSKTLERDVDWTWVDEQRTRGMEYLVRYYRLKQAIVFRLSNDVLQFNFFDHTKLILTESAQAVTFIGPDYRLKTYALASLMREAGRLGLLRNPEPMQFDLPADHEQQEERRQRKQAAVHFMLGKLVYALEAVRGLAQKRSGSKTSS